MPRGRRAYANARRLDRAARPFLQDTFWGRQTSPPKDVPLRLVRKRLGDRELKIWGSVHD
jgi:hypothetical protein